MKPFSRSIVELGGLERAYLLIIIAHTEAEKGPMNWCDRFRSAGWGRPLGPACPGVCGPKRAATGVCAGPRAPSVPPCLIASGTLRCQP